MIKKTLNPAELDFIRLEAQDVLTGPSAEGPTISDDETQDVEAPSRFNYRGVEKGYEDEEDW